MTLSVGAATDYLVQTATQAAVGITVEGQLVVVHDGEPATVTLGQFVIGLSDPPPQMAGDTTGTRGFMGVGAQRLEEDYTVPCYIDIRVPGTVQKTARDIAVSVFDAFWPLIRADLTLGGALKGGRYAEITEVTHMASNVGTVAEPGRRHLIAFGVHCRNLTS